MSILYFFYRASFHCMWRIHHHHFRPQSESLSSQLDGNPLNSSSELSSRSELASSGSSSSSSSSISNVPETSQRSPGARRLTYLTNRSVPLSRITIVILFHDAAWKNRMLSSLLLLV